MSELRTKAPPAGPPPAMRTLEPARHDLLNGMRVVALERTALPEVALRLVVPAGAGAQPVAIPGTASLVGRLLTEGAAGRDSREMARWIDGLGLDVAVAVGYDAAIIRIHTLTELLESALDVLSAIALSPDFLEPEVDRIRAERVDRLERLRDDPDHVATDVLPELLYGDLSYGRRPWGRPETVSVIDRNAIASFHESRYAPGVTSLVAVGAIDERFSGWVADRFGDWQGESADTAPPPTPARPDTSRTVLVHRPGSRQSVIRMAGIGLARGAAGETAARVMNAILGGLFNSRLNLNLREDKGWTYGARSSLDLRRAPGPITMKASVETAVTAQAVSEMRYEVGRMRESLPSDAEMETAFGALTRSLPLRFETASQVAGRLVEQIVYELPDDYWSRYVEGIGLVTPDEVRAAAARLLDPGGLVTLVVGDADEVGPELERLGAVDVRDAS